MAFWGLVVSLALALVWRNHMVWKGTQTAGQSHRVLVVDRPVARGEKIQWGDFSLSLSEKGPEDGVAEVYMDKISGAVALHDLEKGQIIRYSDLRWRAGLRERVPSGAMAYSVDADTNLPVREMDQVDLFITPLQGGVPDRIIEAADVLALSGSGKVILALTSDEIRIIEKALQTGKLKIAVRSAADSLENRPPLRLTRKRTQKANKVEVWEEEP